LRSKGGGVADTNNFFLFRPETRKKKTHEKLVLSFQFVKTGRDYKIPEKLDHANFHHFHFGLIIVVLKPLKILKKTNRY